MITALILLVALLYARLFLGLIFFSSPGFGFRMWLWDKPCSNFSVWFTLDNIGRCCLGGTIFLTRAERRRRAEDHWSHKRYCDDTIWWAIGGFSGTIRISAWPFERWLARRVDKMFDGLTWGL